MIPSYIVLTANTFILLSGPCKFPPHIPCSLDGHYDRFHFRCLKTCLLWFSPFLSLSLSLSSSVFIFNTILIDIVITIIHMFFMEPPTMLLVPICRDMQFWWDKPPIPSLRNCMPTETCFDDVGRIRACVTWSQMYVTLQSKNVFHSKAVIILFFNQPLCIIFFRYSFQYRRNSIRPSTHFIHFWRRSAVKTIIFEGHAH